MTDATCPPLIFLDIDGVLNDHRKLPNGATPIYPEKIELLNTILADVPEAKIVLSSAWRYTFNTLGTARAILWVNGCHCLDRMHGITESDEVTHDGQMPELGEHDAWHSIGLRLRAAQILKYISEHQPPAFVVLDDLLLDVPNLIRTDGNHGLTGADAARAVELLQGLL